MNYQKLQEDLFRPEILHIGTGGTISAVKGERGIAPEYRAEQIYRLVSERRPRLKRYGTVGNVSLMNIDSTNMSYTDRGRLARYIVARSDEGYKKVVVTHGTDTAEETLHYLAFTVLDPDKRIFITGSTFPFGEEDTDAYDNFVSAVVAAKKDLDGVFIVYDGEVIFGPRAAKIDPYSLKAFAGKRFPLVGNIRRFGFTLPIVKIPFYFYWFRPNKREKTLEKIREINENLRFYLGGEPLHLSQPLSQKVGHIELLADKDPKDLDMEFSVKRRDAVVLEVYGSGGVPDKWLPHIERWRKKEKQIIITSRCDQPLITLDYPMMKDAHAMGVIVGYDMLPRAAVIKTMIADTYLKDNPVAFRKYMQGNVRGEINPEIVKEYEGSIPPPEELRDIFSLIREHEMQFRKAKKAESNGDDPPISVNVYTSWERFFPEIADNVPEFASNWANAVLSPFVRSKKYSSVK